jgi:hypothetical protein
MPDSVFTPEQEARIVALLQAELQRIGLMGHWEITDGPNTIARWVPPTEPQESRIREIVRSVIRAVQREDELAISAVVYGPIVYELENEVAPSRTTDGDKE